MKKERVESDKTENSYDSVETMELVEGTEDLGLKIGTKEEAFWTEIKDKTEKEIETLEKMLKFNKAILDMARFRINDEKMKGGKNDRSNRKTDKLC